MILGKKELIEHFKDMGICNGMTIEVVGSIENMGFIAGGAQTVVDALIETVGYNGTILMPFHCVGNTEPSTWINPIISPELVSEIREKIPSFSPKESEILYQGSLVDNLRRRDGIVVSYHPNRAYVAWGRYSKLLCNSQSLNFAYSYNSPANKLNELKGYVLLLGVDYDQSSSLLFAQYINELAPIGLNCAMIDDHGKNIYTKLLDIDFDINISLRAGRILERNNLVTIKKIGNGVCKLFPFDLALNFTAKFIKEISIIALYKGE